MGKLSKEYVDNDDFCNAIVSIRECSTHCKTFKYFAKLARIAKKDFPNLKNSEISVVQYGGRFIKGMHGIEFQVKLDTVPETYKKSHILEDLK